MNFCTPLVVPFRPRVPRSVPLRFPPTSPFSELPRPVLFTLLTPPVSVPSNNADGGEVSPTPVYESALFCDFSCPLFFFAPICYHTPPPPPHRNQWTAPFLWRDIPQSPPPRRFYFSLLLLPLSVFCLPFFRVEIPRFLSYGLISFCIHGQSSFSLVWLLTPLSLFEQG